MKGYEKIGAIIAQAHSEADDPIVALVAESAQAMRVDGCRVTVGSGESTHDAVSAAVTKAGRMHDWVVVVSQVDADGNHVMPPLLCHAPMHDLKRDGMNAVFYIPADADSEWEVYTPN